MHWLIRPWRQMLDFNGRATRREFWLFHLQTFVLIVLYVVLVGEMVRGSGSAVLGVLLTLLQLVPLAVIVVASLSVAVRRLHDHDKSGWFYLLTFVPLIGWLFFLFMMLTPGTNGENSYGYDPRDGDQPPAEDVAAVFS
jgi:uncharacterized membrane protein YhaH (DUF805 family)